MCALERPRGIATPPSEVSEDAVGGCGRDQSWGRRVSFTISICNRIRNGQSVTDSDRPVIEIETGEGGNTVSFDLISLILQAGLIVKLVLLVLLGFSITSITIIVSKWTELRAADEDSEAFLEV